MSNTVYVIGAGFSKGIGLPASKDFVSSESFQYLKEKLNDDSESITKIQNLENYVKFRLENNYCDDNIESVLNHVATAKYLYMDSMTEKSGYSADDIFGDLCWYIARLIKEKTDDIAKIPDEYNTFVKTVYENKDSLVTFNYDLILEAVLSNLEHEYDYGVSEKTNDDSQLILKLHGSLNWGLCEKCGPVDIYDHILTFEKDSAISCPLCSNEIISPLLVPPVIYKDSYYNEQPLVRDSWSLANEQLSAAKKIVFIGFSMAQDAYVAELFKLSLNMNSHENLKCVVVNRTCGDILRGRYDSVLVNVEPPEYVESTFIEYVQNYMN